MWPSRARPSRASSLLIVDRDLFDAVQAKLNEQVNKHKASRTKSEALLLGRIYDDRGHRMTPSHARRRGTKYRYYLSSALLQGRAKQAGTVSRVPADEIEALIVKSVRGHLNVSTEIEDAVLIHTHVVRIEAQSDQLVIELSNAKGDGRKRKQSRNVIQVPWRKTPPTRRHEILMPDTSQPENARPIRSENRALLVASIAQGRRWLGELIADPAATTESIARRVGCTTRKINMTISLAFLAPTSSRRPLMDGSRTAWELPVSPTCLPNGPASAKCLASLCCKAADDGLRVLRSEKNHAQERRSSNDHAFTRRLPDPLSRGCAQRHRFNVRNFDEEEFVALRADQVRARSSRHELGRGGYRRNRPHGSDMIPVSSRSATASAAAMRSMRSKPS